MQFRIKTLLLVMLILSVFFGYAAYFRPACRTVSFESAVVPIKAQGTWSENLTKVENSPYSYKLLTNNELTELRSQFATLGKVIFANKSSVHMWPQQATSQTGVYPLYLPVIDPEQGSNPAKIPATIAGALCGFLGTRRAGQQVQLRVDMDANLHMPEERDIYSPLGLFNEVKADGHLFYQGQVPTCGLVFIAPIGEHSVHVVLFEVESQQ